MSSPAATKCLAAVLLAGGTMAAVAMKPDLGSDKDPRQSYTHVPLKKGAVQKDADWNRRSGARSPANAAVPAAQAGPAGPVTGQQKASGIKGESGGPGPVKGGQKPAAPTLKPGAAQNK